MTSASPDVENNPDTARAASGRTGAAALVDTLAHAGVTDVFGIPGEHCLAVVDAIDKREGMRFISVRHESAAGYMAEAQGKLSGRPGACLGTASVGAANLVAGVNVAHHDSTPVAVIVGQVATGLLGRDAWQEIDLVGLFGPITRHAAEITHVGKVNEVAARALGIAQVNRPGPVLLSVPVDVQEAEAPVGYGVVTRPRAPAPDRAAIKQVAALLAGARRPLIVVGGGVRASGAREDLVGLVDELGVPVVTGFRRTDAFPNDSDHYLGALGLSASESVRHAVSSADLLIMLGTRLSELTTLRYLFPAANQASVHIDVDAATLASQAATPADISIVSDTANAVRALREECANVELSIPERWWADEQVRLGEAALGRAAPAEGLPPGRRLTRQVADVVERLLPADGVVTSDAGDFFLDCAPAIRFTGERRFLGPTSGTMGYGLPAAVAAKLAEPSRVCVALCGDGGLMMSVQEIETAVRYNAGVVVIVFNNFAYGSIVRHQSRRPGGSSVGTRLGNPSFAALADLFGATGHTVSEIEGFTSAFEDAIGSEGVHVIEVLI